MALSLILVAYSMYMTACLNYVSWFIQVLKSVLSLPPEPTALAVRDTSLYKLSIVPHCYIWCSLATLDLGLRCTFRWTFIIADVNKPILDRG